MKKETCAFLLLLLTGCAAKKPIPQFPNTRLSIPRASQPIMDGVSGDVETIATVCLGSFCAELLNAHLCSESPSPITMGAERVALSQNMQILSRGQATFLLNRRKALSWQMTVQDAGIAALAESSYYAKIPAVALAIPVLQIVMNFLSRYQIDIQPFLDEMLPANVALAAKGSAGECVTGSVFASQSSGSPLFLPRRQRIQ